MKKVKVLAVAVPIVLLVCLLGAVAWLQNSIKGIVEERGGQALGVKTTLETVDLSLLSGELDLGRLLVANPDGFQSPTFLDVDHVKTQVRIGSLWSEVVEVPTIVIQDVTVQVEGDRGRFNYQPILSNLRKSIGSGRESTEGRERKLHISTLEIKNIRARLDLRVGPALLRDAEIRIPDVTIRDLGSGGQPLPMDRLMRLIVESVMRGVADQGKGQLTRELLTNLWGQLSGETPTDGGKKEPDIKGVVDDLQKLLRQP